MHQPAGRSTRGDHVSHDRAGSRHDHDRYTGRKGELPNTTADRMFAEAADICYQKTPVITNISTHLAFATCMGDTPLPPGNCARNFRYYVLKSTNEDPTTAGFARETATARLAREAYLRGEGYDGIRLEYVPCGNATEIPTSFYQ